MSTQYGIGVTKNRYELFDSEDEDPLEVLKNCEQEKEERKKTKLSEKENKGKEPAVIAKSILPRKGIKETQNLKPQEGQKPKEDVKARVPRVDRGDRKITPDNREERNNRRNRDERIQNDPFREDRKDSKTERTQSYGDSASDARRGGSRGGRGGYIPRGARGGGRGGPRTAFDARGKREYDRQSGSDKTGVKPIDKRDGSGAHNWGTIQDDLEDIQGQPPNAPPEDTTWDGEKPENDAQPTEPNTAEPENEESSPNVPDEEKKELTLDEWKALKAPRQKPTYNIRKAGEGEDQTQWKKMYALQKKKEGEEDDDEEYEYESLDYPQRVGRQKHVLDIDIHFKDTRGVARGRNTRGPGRAGTRMGGPRGPNPPVPEKFQPQVREPNQKLAPKVDDEHDFPSLG